MPGIESRTLKDALKWLASKRHENKLLVSSLMMNLDKTSIEQAKLLINIRALAVSQESIFDFPIFEDAASNERLRARELIFINGSRSMKF